jgi:hypothetical protein
MRKTLAALVVLGVAAVLQVGSAAPASAACNRGSFCIYDGYNRTGTMWQWAGNDNSYVNNGADNKASSAWNNGYVATYDRVWLFQDRLDGPSQGGNLLGCFYVGDRVNFSGSWAYANNKASAHNWSYTCY